MFSSAMQGAAGTSGAQHQDVGGVLRATFGLYRSQASKLWTIVALVVVPVQVLVAIIVRAALSGGTTFASGGTIYTSNSTALPAVAIIALGFIASVVSTGALSKCLVDAYSGNPTDWRQSLSYAAGRLGPLIWLAILAGALLTIAFILLVIPGIFLLVAWVLAVPVLMFEGIAGLGALRRSHELVRGHWWATFGALFVAVICIIAMSIVVGLLLGGIANSGSVDVIIVVSAISRVIGAILAYPVVAAVTAVIYVDLSGRRENVGPHDLTGAAEPPEPPQPPEPPEQPPAPTLPDIGLS